MLSEKPEGVFYGLNLVSSAGHESWRVCERHYSEGVCVETSCFDHTGDEVGFRKAVTSLEKQHIKAVWVPTGEIMKLINFYHQNWQNNFIPSFDHLASAPELPADFLVEIGVLQVHA